MEALGKAHVPYGAEGEGKYTLTTKGCFNVMENATAEILNCIDVIPFSSGKSGPFVICDFGTADGGTSMKLLDHIIGKIRKKHPKQEVLVQYEDQPNNDYKSLFFHMQGINQVTDLYGESITPYLSKYNDVFVTCCGTSYFKQCFPSSSVHFGMCVTAMHWLSQLPCYVPNGIHHTQAVPGSPEFLQFQSQAEKDWTSILVNRGKELCIGGRFVVVNLCTDENGFYLGNTAVKYNMFTVFNEIWSSMRDEEIITADEYFHTTMCNYYRNDEEVRRPFNDSNSEVHKMGLRLVSLKSQITPCPYYAYWNSSKCTLTPEEYSKLYVGTLRCWSNSTFLSALSTERSVKEREGIVDQVYEKYCHRVADEPGKFAMDYVHHYIVIEKVA